MVDITTLDLANIYARYFVEDFAIDVMRHLSGSYPIDADRLRAEIESAMREELSQTPLMISSDNAVGRFLYECATYAIEEDIPDAAERAGWDIVKALPSQHHAEIQAVVYQSAQQYLQVVNKTLLGTIGRDAALTHNKLKTLTDERLRSSDTGGIIREFSWGILSNGQWLNAALMRAYDLASVFRAGDPVIPSYVEVSFNFAYGYATVPESEVAYETGGKADLHALFSHANTYADGEIADTGLDELGDSLFQPGYLRASIDVAQRGISDVKELIWATERFSQLAENITSLLSTARDLDDDTLISPLTVSALSRVNNAVTLTLAGIEALRETKFADSLIMLVTAEGNDPSVTVTVNSDTLRSFTQNGGTDQDLIYFGLYLDPRKGMTLPSTGWSLDSLLSQRDVVIPEIMSQEADRLEQLRNNDAAFVDQTAVNVVKDVVQSYLRASDRPLLPYLEQQIDRFGRDVANQDNAGEVATESLTPDAHIAKILVAAIGDPFLEQVRVNFTTYAQSCNQELAPHLTVMRTAVQDAMHFITMKEEPVEA